MNKKNKILTMVLIILTISFVFERINTNKSDVYEEQNKSSIKKNKNLLSMNLEQTAGAGDYKTVTQSGWPTDGYKFNTELSRCENGSTLNWDDTKKAVIVSGNLSDKCYVYFDIRIPSIADYCTGGTDLATCVKNFGDQRSNVSNIYIHDSSLTNGAGDNSYRYTGANPDNFVCFGSTTSPCPTDNLYRIIGVFGENYHGVSGKQLVKLIKYDYANSNLLGTDGDYYGSGTPDTSYYNGSLTTINRYYWNYKATGSATNTWSTSLLNKTNLNTNFINNVGTTWVNKIATVKWKVGGNTFDNITGSVPSTAYQNEVVNPVIINTTDNATEYSAKIGLMYASDYGFAAVPEAWTTTLYKYDGSVNSAKIRSQNWMHMGYNEWTISRYAGDSSFAFFVYNYGSVYYYIVYLDRDGHRGVRPTFFLEPSVTYVRGTGTMSDPIVIN